MSSTSHDVNLILKARDEASAKLNALGKSIGGLSSIAGLATKALGFFGAALSIRSVVQFAGKTLEAAKGLKDAATVFGESAETIGTWKYFAGIEGMPFEKFTASLTKMTDAIGEAWLTGNDTVFERLGLDVRRLYMSGTSESLNQIADALSNVHNSALQTKLGMDIFGKSAFDILPMIRDGSAGLKKMADEGKELGAVMTDLEVNMADFYSQQYARIKASTAGAGRKAAVKGVGWFQDFMYLGNVAFSESNDPNNKEGWLDYFQRTKPSAVALQEAQAAAAQQQQDNLDRLKASGLAARDAARQKQQEILDSQTKQLMDKVWGWQEQFKSPLDEYNETKNSVVSAIYRGMMSTDLADLVLDEATKNYFDKVNPKKPIIVDQPRTGWTLFESRTASHGGGRQGASPAERTLERIEKHLALIAGDTRKREPARPGTEIRLTSFR